LALGYEQFFGVFQVLQKPLADQPTEIKSEFRITRVAT